MRPSWPLSAIALCLLPAALAARQPLCPAPCTSEQSKWTPYSSLEKLNECHHSVLIDFPSHVVPNTTEVSFKVVACTIEENPETPELAESFFVDSSEEEKGVSVSSPRFRQLSFLLGHAQAALTEKSNRENRSVLARHNTTSVGIYSGVGVGNALAGSVVEAFKSNNDVRSGRSSVMQLCSREGLTFGIAVDATGDSESVQDALSSWAKAECLEDNDGLIEVMDAAAVRMPMQSSFHNNITIAAGATKRLACKKVTVRQGDTCALLAERCGIKGPDFMKYNPEEGLCAWLRPGQDVCCSERVLTKGKPYMNQDGSCASYVIEHGDSCFSIANDHQLEESDILYYNDGRTWGWSGCDLIQPGLKICLSEGYPPLPSPKAGATCGPTVPGTEMPKDGTPLASLNPCPLNACCNTLGNCGASPDYCIYQEGPTGNPGTAPPGLRGCVSNCGLDIIDSSEQPEEFMRVGYYVSFNLDRPCLNLRAAHIPVNDYTHINWGFASINEKFQISVNDTHDQWEDFLALQGVKRIISLGGWGYSVNRVAYDVLREAMLPENVDTFIVNLMEFVANNGLDGVDLDWEYPGASDLNHINHGLRSDGPNYLEFVKKLRRVFPRDKIISVAAPASYWHLRAFPIKEMWPHVDYIIYMTYDFHGQWDYENFLIQDWCEGGNCLRSHVNLTETEYAFSLITKAGVPRSSIVVGVASYGRAFGMTDADCTGPECRFVGPQTAATPGVCTNTPGILAIAEIEALILEGDVDESYYDRASDSNILVYNRTQWVAFMSKSTLRRRIEYYQSMDFAGFANWAVDLTHWSGDDPEPEERATI
ncbi:glycoside hydrolase superfamily [Aspergillus unguis]